MNRNYLQVRTFHTASEEVMSDKPTMLDRGHDEAMGLYIRPLKAIIAAMRRDGSGGDLYFRTSLVMEEIVEFMEATTLVDQVDAAGDAIYILLGTFTKMGVLPEAIMDIIAEANLAKILPDGTVMRDETGKITKPPGWEENYAPEERIRLELERQAAGE